MRLLICLLAVLLSGCVSWKPLDIEPHYSFVRKIGECSSGISSHNKYAIIIRSRLYQMPDYVGVISTAKQVVENGIIINDDYQRGDVDQMQRLLTNKQYSTYVCDFAHHSLVDLKSLMKMISLSSNDQTQLMVCYVGEEANSGFGAVGIKKNGAIIYLPDAYMSVQQFYEMFSDYRGESCVIIGACRSGKFTNSDVIPMNYRGVVIAACDSDSKTTPYEPDEMTAIYAGFLDWYDDDPSEVYDLSQLDFKSGGWLCNWWHQLNNLFGQWKISYEPVVVQKGSFRF